MAAVIPWVLGALGVGALVKGLFRPHRAIAKKGTVARCAGPNQFGACDPSDAVSVPQGDSVYATGAGKVVAVGDRFVHILVGNEPVILMYDGVVPDVEEDQYVGRGQKIGESTGIVYFSVTELKPGRSGPLPYIATYVAPAAWLAARGMREVVKNTGPKNKWCEQGRHIEVPMTAARSCKLQKPEPAGFALLPVSVSIEG